MDCKQADGFMMQYAENTIEPNDAKDLAKHLLVCEDCRESFVAFDICLDETPVIEAPIDFAQNVMTRVKDMKAANVVLPLANTALQSPRFSSKFVQAAIGLCAILVGVILFIALNFGYAGDFFGTMSELVQYYSIAIAPLFDSLRASLGSSTHFSQFTFIFVPVLSVLLFVLHSTEKSDLSQGDSVEA